MGKLLECVGAICKRQVTSIRYLLATCLEPDE
jgi:hypothetical protein